jgi:hypothetical protein
LRTGQVSVSPATAAFLRLSLRCNDRPIVTLAQPPDDSEDERCAGECADRCSASRSTFARQQQSIRKR